MSKILKVLQFITAVETIANLEHAFKYMTSNAEKVGDVLEQIDNHIGE